MRFNYFLIFSASLFALPVSYAAQGEFLGSVSAEYVQTCGNTIQIHLADLTGNNTGHTLLGLKNRDTGKIDLFMSNAQVSGSQPYDKYTHVFFDNISKHYVTVPNGLSIVWGAATDNTHNTMVYKLALGKHIYNCGELEKIPDDRANRLYGEAETTHLPFPPHQDREAE